MPTARVRGALDPLRTGRHGYAAAAPARLGKLARSSGMRGTGTGWGWVPAGGAEAPGAATVVDCCESPEVSVEPWMSSPIVPLAVASPVFAFSVVLSPTETIAPFWAITMWLPLATICIVAGPV